MLQVRNFWQNKRRQLENEAIKSDIVGQAHMESCALQLFAYADTEDRAARFSKWVSLNKKCITQFFPGRFLLFNLSLSCNHMLIAAIFSLKIGYHSLVSHSLTAGDVITL